MVTSTENHVTSTELLRDAEELDSGRAVTSEEISRDVRRLFSENLKTTH